MFIANLFKSRRRLEAEILFLRHQLNIALRRRPARLPLRGSDRALLVWMTRLWPSLLCMARVVEPATILGVASSKAPEQLALEIAKAAGRLRIDRGLRDIIRRMSRENWLREILHGLASRERSPRLVHHQFGYAKMCMITGPAVAVADPTSRGARPAFLGGRPKPNHAVVRQDGITPPQARQPRKQQAHKAPPAMSDRNFATASIASEPRAAAATLF